ncbi:hypothetical protein OQI_30425 [Streptomyces pharetrae CZA14]|uniref:Uncharacterized protein n=1 Tax=Streptomyces pharetrae CZA14 TaxID=1144883 RepID=A0ABX3YCB5_9ACTN|nr:hypothetical protein OQI_30425 [Streptomyces pharetrae CZA14]
MPTFEALQDRRGRRRRRGRAGFLTRLLRAEFDESPLGDLSLWGRGSAVFLTVSEYQRRLEQGLDPWRASLIRTPDLYGR